MRRWQWVLSSAAFLLEAMFLAAASAVAADVPGVVSGKVFLDANGNGKLDAGKKPLPGVRVTDGLSFVTTAADGSYSITIGKDPAIPYRGSQVISVCWPQDTWPSGPWWARLDQIKDPAHVDFALRRTSRRCRSPSCTSPTTTVAVARTQSSARRFSRWPPRRGPSGSA